MAEWFYQDGGQHIGPVTKRQLQRLFRNGEIRGDTPVWNENRADGWGPVGHSEIAVDDLQDKERSLRHRAIAGYVLAFSPLLGSLIALLISHPAVIDGGTRGTPVEAISVAFTAVALLEINALQRLGYSISKWNCLLVPLYLYKLSRLLKRARDFPIIWIMCFGISIPIVLYLDNPTAAMSDRGFAGSPGSSASNFSWPARPKPLNIPACDSAFADEQVSSIAKRIPLLQAENLGAFTLQAHREVFFDGTKRACLATLSGGNGKQYSLTYSLEHRDDGLIHTHAEVQR